MSVYVVLQVEFLLYTRDNPLLAQKLTASRPPLIASNYDGNKKTKFIIHGYKGNGHEPWVHEMTAAILAKVSYTHQTLIQLSATTYTCIKHFIGKLAVNQPILAYLA